VISEASTNKAGRAGQKGTGEAKSAARSSPYKRRPRGSSGELSATDNR